MRRSHGEPNDRLAKLVFSRPDGGRALLTFALPPAVRDQLDLDTLALVPANPIGQRLREGLADVLFSVACAREPVFVHVLIEHKSRAERFTILDAFESCGRIWRDWRTKNPGATNVPRIIPILLFHGERPWSAATTLAQVFAGGSEIRAALRPLEPTFPLVLVDLAHRDDDEFARLASFDALAAAALFVLKWSRAIDFARRLCENAELLARVFALPDGRDHLALLLDYVFLVGTAPGDGERLIQVLSGLLPKEAEDLMKSWADQLLEKGIEQGIEKGLEQGIEKGLEQGIEKGVGIGEVRGLRRSIRGVLAARFGSVPDAVARAVEGVAVWEELDRLLLAAATCASIAAFAREMER